MNIFYNRGIYVVGDRTKFVVDPTGPVGNVDFVLVTHGHSDHISRHMFKHTVVATRETFSAISVKFGGVPPKRITTAPGRVLEINDVEIAVFEAGHILGSVMYLVEIDGVQILFTGDFNTVGSILTEAAEPVEKPDILVMEATYGDPAYVFPNRAEVYNHLIDVVETVSRERGVAIAAYPLGKAQEVIKLLGTRTGVHKSIARYNSALGIPIGRNKDVVIVPNVKNAPPGYFKIEVSGWYAVGGVRDYVYGIPLSDHSDFRNLLQFAIESSPKLVYTVYGFADRFANRLKKMGMKAYELPPPLFI